MNNNTISLGDEHDDLETGDVVVAKFLDTDIKVL